MERRVISLNDHFVGLRRDSRDRYSKHCEVCRGLKAEPFGLTVLEDITAPDATTVTWPFPQLGYNGSYLRMNETEIATFNSSWVASAQTIYALSDLGSSWILGSATGSITAGGIWQLARNDSGWIAFNGNCVVFGLPSNDSFAGATFASTSPRANCGCSYNGRFILGGLGNFLSSSFNSSLAGWLDSSVDSMAGGDNWIWYSDVGGEDLWYYFFPWMCTEEKFQLLQKRNVAGFAVMPLDGEVLAVKQLGNGVMVYGEDGICLLQPDSSGHFSVTPLSLGGIKERGAVGGSVAQHLFVDVVGDAYKIGTDFQLQKVGCKDYLEDLDNFYVSYDPYRGDFYVSGLNISDVARGYLFSSSGVTEVLEGITGLCRVGEGLYGYTKAGYSGTGLGIVAELGPLLFETHEAKTLQALRIVTTDPTNFYAQVRTRESSADSWGSYSDALYFSQNGWANFGITGREFYLRICSLGADYETTLDMLNLEAVVEYGGRHNIGSMLS